MIRDLAGYVTSSALGVTGGKPLFGVSFGYADPAATINAVTAGHES